MFFDLLVQVFGSCALVLVLERTVADGDLCRNICQQDVAEVWHLMKGFVDGVLCPLGPSQLEEFPVPYNSDTESLPDCLAKGRDAVVRSRLAIG